MVGVFVKVDMLQLILPTLLSVAFFVGSTYAAFPDCSNGTLSTNGICDQSLSPVERAKALVAAMTLEEKIANTVNTAPGVPRLGLPAYEWWSEALHGVAQSPGVKFASSGEFSSATSFPLPINLGASFDDSLVYDIALIIAKEARAFNNANRAGLDYWTPNINPFKDPRWGRGHEVPTEDAFHMQQYTKALVKGLQGDGEYRTTVATCKHYAAYDMENWQGVTRHEFDAVVGMQELVEYYLPPFKACVDANVGSFMCSYNAVNGVPACADPYLLQTVLREHWDWSADDQYITSDCGAIDDIYDGHDYVSTPEEAAAVSVKAGTDLECGDVYADSLGGAVEQSLITEEAIEVGLVRSYASLVKLGYFDPPEQQPLRQLGWEAVNTQEGQDLAYKSAVEGTVLLKNDGTLPFTLENQSIAVIGPLANATVQMQASYKGIAPFLISPLNATQALGVQVNYAFGTNMTNGTSGYSEALAAANSSDIILFVGGIDTSIEHESFDRNSIAWPSNQLELIQELADVGKPLIVLQLGGGQVDDAELIANANVNAIVWGGYPGQSGGTALLDIIFGKQAPAGRLPITQYPASYVDEVNMFEMALRPTSESPGRTYKWYEGVPTLPFGHGLHYTTFSTAVGGHDMFFAMTRDFALQNRTFIAEFDVTNTGNVTSDYVALLFVRVQGSAAPGLQPRSSLVAYERLKAIAPAEVRGVSFNVGVGAFQQVDENGNTVLFAGQYDLVLDLDGPGTIRASIDGEELVLDVWPQKNETAS